MARTSISGWAPVVGEWSFGGGVATYLSPPPGVDRRPFGIAVSALRLSEGDAAATVRWDRSDSDFAARLLFGYRSPNHEYYTVGLGGYGHAFVVSHYEPTRGWAAVALAGSPQNLLTEHDYQIRVRIRGQRVFFDFNGIQVLDQVLAAPLPEGQLGLFGWGHGGVSFSEITASKSHGKAFVVMKLDGSYDELYREVIVPTAEKFELRAFHAGDMFGPGFILDDIVNSIVESKVVIAEITSLNPNVFYEVGYAHAIGKPTILLAEHGKALPFDISGYRCLFYENSIGGKAKVEQALQKHLEALFGPR